MTASTARHAPWWQLVDELSADDAPDPWVAYDQPAPSLTRAQREVLVGFDDQPSSPRLRQLTAGEVEAATGNGTGSSPGDNPTAHPYGPKQ